MDIDFNLFNEHINGFNCEDYLLNNKIDKIIDHQSFYDSYLKLIQDEILKTQQLNAKFSKLLFEKNNKNTKLNRNNSYGSEFKKVCSFESINDENEKLNIIIRTYLNKISNDTFDRVSEKLIDKLMEVKNVNIFKILSEEIVNKCIYDNKYRHLYIHLCYKIWNNKKIHYNLINIEKENNNFYALYVDLDNEEVKLGPFNCVEELKETVFKKINFKNYFIDFIQELYKNKNINLDELDDTTFFDIKKRTLLLVELLAILFINKYINFDIINLIIIDLLHKDNNFDIIKEIEFELLHVMMKFIYENNKTFKFIEFKKIFDDYKNTLESIVKMSSEFVTKRSIFFIENTIIIFNKILKNEKFEEKITDKDNNIIEEIINHAYHARYLKFLTNLEELNLNQKKEIINKIINSSLENIDHKNLLGTLKYIKKNYILIIENSLSKIINNLDDIILDIPYINKNIIQFIEYLELNKNLETSLHNKMDLIKDTSDDSDDDFSFR